MNILITGGSGFIGANLVNFLLEKNENEVVVCDKYQSTDYFID